MLGCVGSWSTSAGVLGVDVRVGRLHVWNRNERIRTVDQAKGKASKWSAR
jgi:hypothetical protein